MLIFVETLNYNMTTIYFDQFAISGMSEPTNNLWYQIRNILFDTRWRN